MLIKLTAGLVGIKISELYVAFGASLTPNHTLQTSITFGDSLI
jgi:hypothetical protein